MGNKVIEEEIPAELMDDAVKYNKELIEKIAELDDELTMKFLEGEEIPYETLRETLRKGVIENKIVPVFTGSALKNVGVQKVLDAVVDYLPAPTDIPPITKTSDTLCDEANPIELHKIEFAEPVISMKIEPKTKADQEKMGMALKRLSDEDPTFRVTSDDETMETVISGMGELHLEILVDRLKREFNVEANVGKPQVAYRETITGTASGEHKYIKQSGGKGQYGHVKINVKPLEHDIKEEDLPKNVKRSEGFEFINSIKGGTIPAEYIPACEKGFKETMDRGIVAGYKMTDVSVELYDGSYHDVDSSEIAFKLAASHAFQEAAKKANAVILEPIMKVEVITPEEFTGDITGNLSSKRGQVEGMEDRGNGLTTVHAKVPLSELFGYTTIIRSMTQGRAAATIEPDHYDIVPANVAEDIKAGKA
jgi:elongation factor G